MQKKVMLTLVLLLAVSLVFMVSCQPKTGPGPSPDKPGDTGKPDKPGDPGAAAKMKVYVTNYPLKYFAERIAGDKIDLIYPIPADIDPAFWEPTEEEVKALQNADLIITNGATYEKWMPKVALSKKKILDTSKVFKDDYVTIKEVTTHSHGPKGEHSHSGIAFTTWIDFNQAAKQAEAVKEGLVKLVPDAKDDFEKNYEALNKDLMDLDKEIKDLTAKNPDVLFVASHPVYDYFSRRYNMKVKSVLWEPDVMPDEKGWKELEGILKDHKATWMIWEGEPIEDSVKKLDEMKIKGIVFDPCGNTPDKGDFLTVMKANVENLKKVYE